MEEKSLRGLRCLGLTRCSSKGQGGEGLSNDQQVEILKAFAEKKEMIWVEEKRAEGVSASKTQNRKDIDDLLHRAETVGDFEVLLVLSYDRLTRGGSSHGGYLLHKFGELGVQVISATNETPADDEYGSLIQQIEFIRGRGTAKSISFHSARGSAASIFDGRMAYTKRPPYGIDRLILSSTCEKLFRIRNLPDGTQVKLHYSDDSIVIERYARNEKVGPSRHFLKHVDQKIILVNGAPEAVQTLQLMYDLHWVRGMGSRRIALELNTRGIPSPHGKTWGQCCVFKILMNPIYSQRGICNRVTEAEFHPRPARKGESPPMIYQYRKRAQLGRERAKMKPKCRVFRPQSDWLLSSHPEIQILSKELREAILGKQMAYQVREAEQDLKVDRRRPKYTSKYLLLGSIVERSTGRRMSAYTSGRNGRHRYYAVPGAHNNPTPETMAKKKFYPADAVEMAVLDCLKGVLAKPDDYVPMLERYAEEQLAVQSQDVSDVNSLKAERAALAEKKAFTLDQYGDIGVDLLRKRIEPMTAKLFDLDRRIEMATRASGCSIIGAKEAVKTVLGNLKGVASMLGESSPATIRAALNIMTRVEADPHSGECDIEVRVPEDVWHHKFSKLAMCESTTLPTKCGPTAHQQNTLILAKFQCCKEFSDGHRCVKCARKAA